MAKPRLKKKDLSIKEIFQISWIYYKSFDSKYERMKLDVKTVYVIKRQNYKYNRSTKKWEQTGREAKIVFNVVSQPVSYKRIDTRKKHSYPVTFLIRDISMGLNSAFRWRTGSLKRPIIAKKDRKYTKQERIDIANTNIKNHIQLDFFFNLEAVLHAYNLLYGVNYAKWLPRASTNLEHIPYFDKTALFVCLNGGLMQLLESSKIKEKITS